MEKDIKEQLGCLVDELSKYLAPIRTWSEENAREDYTKLVNVNNKIKDIIQDKEEENKEEDEENVLTEKEIEKLNKRLSDIEIEEKPKPVGIIGRKDLNLSEPVEPKEY